MAALRALQQVARRLRARWFVFGAQAVALHGVPRMTQDIDVTLLTAAAPREVFAERIRPRFRAEAFFR